MHWLLLINYAITMNDTMIIYILVLFDLNPNYYQQRCQWSKYSIKQSFEITHHLLDKF